MTRQLFLEIINQQLITPLLLICLTYLIGWFIMLNLGLMALDIKNVNLKKISLLSLVGLFYSFWIKQIVSMQIAGIILPFVIAILLWIANKGIHPLKYGLASIIILLTSYLGDISILAPICSINPKLSNFLLRSAWGFPLSNLVETFFPALALFVLPKVMPKFKNPLTLPVGTDFDNLDHYTFIIYAGMYLTVYTASIVMYVSLISGSKFIFLALIFLWLTMGSIIWAHFRTVKRDKIIKSKLEAEKAQLEADKVKLISDTAKLEADKIGLEAVKNWLEADKARVEAEARQLDIERSRLNELTNKLESENTNLLRQIQEMASLPANGESAREKMLADLLMKYSIESEKILGPIRIKRSKLNDRDKNILNVLSGKSNNEIVEILGLDEKDSIVFISIIQGRSNREIAATLNMAEGSVGNTVGTFLKKYELSDRDQLLPYILEYFKNLGYIQPGPGKLPE